MRLGRLFILTFVMLAPVAASTPSVFTPCTPLVDLVVDSPCAPIHPGGRVYTPIGQCSFNFVVTDGTELYIGTAGHCIQVGQRARLSANDFIGTAVQRSFSGGKDWAFIQIDAEDRDRVSPELGTWGGPTGVGVPGTGDVVLQHGWGATLGQNAWTRGRTGVVAGFYEHGFIYAGHVDSGDSGSAVMLASGEAVGIAVATIILPPHEAVPVTWATRFDEAMAELSTAIGKPVWVVEGRTFLPDN